LKEKSDFLELENLIFIQEINYRKKKLLYYILYEIPIRNSDEKLFFLLEHKSRRSNDFQIQMMKYKQVIHNWQKKEFGRMYSIIPVLFYQGLEIWDIEGDLNEIKKLNNPILSGTKEEFLVFDLQKIEPIKDFVNAELSAGLLLLKIIRFP
jgi:hypothetical protein